MTELFVIEEKMFKFQKSFAEKFVSIIDLLYKSLGITKHNKR